MNADERGSARTKAIPAPPSHPTCSLPCLSAFIRVHPWPFLLLFSSNLFSSVLIRVHPRSSVAIPASASHPRPFPLLFSSNVFSSVLIRVHPPSSVLISLVPLS